MLPDLPPSSDRSWVAAAGLFQEYSEEFRAISGRSRRGQAADADGAITLINQRSVADDLPVGYRSYSYTILVRVGPRLESLIDKYYTQV